MRTEKKPRDAIAEVWPTPSTVYVRPNYTTANPDGWRIASVGHTNDGARWIDWYAPHNAGYEDQLDRAGVYDLRQLLADAWNYQREGLILVPDYIARRLAPAGRAPNNAKTWEALYLAGLFRGPTTPRWPGAWDERKFRRELAASVESYKRIYPRGMYVLVEGRAGDVRDVIAETAKLRGEVIVVRAAKCGWVRVLDVSRPADPLLELHWKTADELRRRPIVANVVSFYLHRKMDRKGWCRVYA